MNEISKDSIPAFILKCFIFFSLLFPIYFAQFDSPYYPEFTVANLFVGFFILFIIFKRRYHEQYKKFSIILLLLLIVYNCLSLYVNFTHLQWLWEEFNVTLAVFFFICLLLCGNMDFFIKKHIIQFTTICTVVTTLCGIITYFIGYASVSLLNGKLLLVAHDPSYYEKRFNWLYFHKSQYCFILLLFIGLIFTYRQIFKNKFLFWLCNLLFLSGILISHTYTALFAAFLIFTGFLIDYLKPRIKKINKVYYLSLIPIFAFILIIINKMGEERNIWTLGSRTFIWSESLRLIFKTPLGIGNSFDTFSFPVPGISFEVYNCHNTFLNEMYRFSLPVGLIFTLFFICIIIYSLKKHFSFLNLGIWIALLISLNMDYALLGRELTITFFFIYCIFFLPYTHKAKCKTLSVLHKKGLSGNRQF